MGGTHTQQQAGLQDSSCFTSRFKTKNKQKKSNISYIICFIGVLKVIYDHIYCGMAPLKYSTSFLIFFLSEKGHKHQPFKAIIVQVIVKNLMKSP